MTEQTSPIAKLSGLPFLMHLDWNSGELLEGCRCFESGKFFEAHEHWETVWLGATEPEKTLLQALIQIAAAFHHGDRKNLLGASSLLRASLGRLQACPEDCGGIDVSALRDQIEQWLGTIENQAAASMTSPRIPFLA